MALVSQTSRPSNTSVPKPLVGQLRGIDSHVVSARDKCSERGEDCRATMVTVEDTSPTPDVKPMGQAKFESEKVRLTYLGEAAHGREGGSQVLGNACGAGDRGTAGNAERAEVTESTHE
ncbi:unnamed protein product, partial [Choristocarpus tenellus]